MATTPTRTSIYTAMRFSSDAPRSPALWRPADAAHRRGQTSAGSASCGGAVQHSTSFPPPGGTSPNPCGNAGLHRSHTRVDRPTAPSDPALCPPGLRGSQEEGRVGVVVAGVNEPGGTAKNGLAGRSAGRPVARALQAKFSPAEHTGG